MNGIKNSIFSIFIVCLIGGIAKTFGTGDKLEKNINMIISLVTVLCLLYPLKAIIPEIENGLKSVEFDVSTTRQEPSQIKSLEYILKKMVCDKYEIQEEMFDISLVYEENSGETDIKEICIEIKSTEAENKSELIKDFLYRQTNCDVDINYSYR